jgi:hypothetical protein
MAWKTPVDYILAGFRCTSAPFKVCAVGAAGEADVDVCSLLDVLHFGVKRRR